jgi:GNAT superfamily N-acetyltransferase
MDVSLDVARTAEDFDGILALQQRYHLEAVAPEAHGTQGFVFARHTRDILARFAAELPQVVARHGDRIVGYTLAMPVSMRDALPELVPMFEQFDRAAFRGRPVREHRYMAGGQVCVAEEARGQGLIGRLYGECGRRLPAAYELCVTEISERNQVSIRAHLRYGFEVIGTYHDGVEPWAVVAWDLDRPGPAAQRTK